MRTIRVIHLVAVSSTNIYYTLTHNIQIAIKRLVAKIQKEKGKGSRP
jgi:hypothetical protein